MVFFLPNIVIICSVTHSKICIIYTVLLSVCVYLICFKSPGICSYIVCFMSPGVFFFFVCFMSPGVYFYFSAFCHRESIFMHCLFYGASCLALCHRESIFMHHTFCPWHSRVIKHLLSMLAKI